MPRSISSCWRMTVSTICDQSGSGCMSTLMLAMYLLIIDGILNPWCRRVSCIRSLLAEQTTIIVFLGPINPTVSRDTGCTTRDHAPTSIERDPWHFVQLCPNSHYLRKAKLQPRGQMIQLLRQCHFWAPTRLQKYRLCLYSYTAAVNLREMVHQDSGWLHRWATFESSKGGSLYHGFQKIDLTQETAELYHTVFSSGRIVAQ